MTGMTDVHYAQSDFPQHKSLGPIWVLTVGALAHYADVDQKALKKAVLAFNAESASHDEYGGFRCLVREARERKVEAFNASAARNNLPLRMKLARRDLEVMRVTDLLHIHTEPSVPRPKRAVRSAR